MANTDTKSVVTRAGPRKRTKVDELTNKLERAKTAIVTDYRGLTVEQLHVAEYGERCPHGAEVVFPREGFDVGVDIHQRGHRV